jgi:hypothetical protein
VPLATGSCGERFTAIAGDNCIGRNAIINQNRTLYDLGIDIADDVMIGPT